MLRKLLANQVRQFYISLILMMVALPLISIGESGGPAVVSTLGVAALAIAAAIPPLRLMVVSWVTRKDSRSP